MHTKFYIIHADWCPHCITLLETMKTIGGYPSKQGEYNVNGTIVRAIEQKELSKPQVKTILGNKRINAFPTILIKNRTGFNEYKGPRETESLIQLFSKYKKPKRHTSKQHRLTMKRSTRKTKPKIVSWLF
jgi:thiol-disulfide isomerase/thioredoxin